MDTYVVGSVGSLKEKFVVIKISTNGSTSFYMVIAFCFSLEEAESIVAALSS